MKLTQEQIDKFNPDIHNVIAVATDFTYPDVVRVYILAIDNETSTYTWVDIINGYIGSDLQGMGDLEQSIEVLDKFHYDGSIEYMMTSVNNTFFMLYPFITEWVNEQAA